MNRSGIFIHGVLGVIISVNLFAANAPIQRVDVVNLLGASGSVPTLVTLAFENGVAAPCYTTTLPYQGSLTVWAGVGQTCIAPITNIVVTPVTGPSGMVYSTPNPVTINPSYYLNQLTISQNAAPVFDPNNGALLMAGTAQAIVVNH